MDKILVTKIFTKYEPTPKWVKKYFFFFKKKIAIYSSEEIFTFPHTSVPFRNEWHFTPRAKRVG